MLDRTEVILDIFSSRAQTHEARLAVELAQLEYSLPRLKGMWTHLSRMKMGVGMRGPGEKQLETDRRLAEKRIQRSQAATSKKSSRRKEREVAGRRDRMTVSLVGYTNAGKSTLMNALTGADVLAEDKLFATLDTRTRRWQLPGWGPVLLSDTVGFIRDLPHHLVASFKATLEEARQADLLIHVADASQPRGPRPDRRGVRSAPRAGHRGKGHAAGAQQDRPRRRSDAARSDPQPLPARRRDQRQDRRRPVAAGRRGERRAQPRFPRSRHPSATPATAGCWPSSPSTARCSAARSSATARRSTAASPARTWAASARPRGRSPPLRRPALPTGPARSTARSAKWPNDCRVLRLHEVTQSYRGRRAASNRNSMPRRSPRRRPRPPHRRLQRHRPRAGPGARPPRRPAAPYRPPRRPAPRNWSTHCCAARRRRRLRRRRRHRPRRPRRRASTAPTTCWGGLDVLINNAGVSAHGRFADSDEPTLRRVMEVNFFAAAELTRLALPLLHVQNPNRRSQNPIPAAIVNIGSIIGHRGLPLNSEYAASKFALRGWSESLRAELAADGVDVLLVSPGTTDTEFFDHLLAKRARPALGQIDSRHRRRRRRANRASPGARPPRNLPQLARPRPGPRQPLFPRRPRPLKRLARPKG